MSYSLPDRSSGRGGWGGGVAVGGGGTGTKRQQTCGRQDCRPVSWQQSEQMKQRIFTHSPEKLKVQRGVCRGGRQAAVQVEAERGRQNTAGGDRMRSGTGVVQQFCCSCWVSASLYASCQTVWGQTAWTRGQRAWRLTHATTCWDVPWPRSARETSQLQFQSE